MTETCAICNGMKWKITIGLDGERYASECDCWKALRADGAFRRSNIPKRYEHCELRSYELDFGVDASLVKAKTIASSFVQEFPVGIDGKGLLFTGSGSGVGKTHLAVGILRELVLHKGVRGLFCDYRELLQDIRHSYSPDVAMTQVQVLRPIFEAEVLVLDELGASIPTDWVWDTVALILNTRYNDKKTTIFTSNFPDLPSAGFDAEPVWGASKAGREAARVARKDTLGDRIGERMRSRLAEMCVVVEMHGEDFRRGVGRARFAI
jgi:DNA replication protein DnaC